MRDTQSAMLKSDKNTSDSPQAPSAIYITAPLNIQEDTGTTEEKPMQVFTTVFPVDFV